MRSERRRLDQGQRPADALALELARPMQTMMEVVCAMVRFFRVDRPRQHCHPAALAGSTVRFHVFTVSAIGWPGGACQQSAAEEVGGWGCKKATGRFSPVHLSL